MFIAFQVVFFVVLFGLAVERTRALCFVGAFDERIASEALLAMTRAELEGCASHPAYVVRALGTALCEEPDEREIALEESLHQIRRELTTRLTVLRIGATTSSLTGLVGAAIAIATISAEAGNVGALTEGSLSIALGIGGSSFAIGAWMALRPHARARLRECERAAERVRRGLAGDLERADSRSEGT